MFARSRLASLAGLSLAVSLVASCGTKPSVEDAQKEISRFDAMQPEDVLCKPGELGSFRKAVRRYSKAKQADGVMWPDFSYKSARPDDLTVTVLAAQYVKLMSPGDIGKAAWHLGELKPDWSSWGAYSDGDEMLGRPNAALLRNGAKYACADLVEYGRALAEHQLGEAYWQERVINEAVLSNRAEEQKADLLQRATKRMAGDLKKVLRLERNLVHAVDTAQMAQR